MVLEGTGLTATDLRQPHLHDRAVGQWPAARRGAPQEGAGLDTDPELLLDLAPQRIQGLLPLLNLAAGQLPATRELGGGGSASGEQRRRACNVIDDGGADDEPGQTFARLLSTHGTGHSPLHPASLMYLGFRDFSPGNNRHKKMYGASRFGNDLLLNQCSGTMMSARSIH
jgi:hypothetical protein